MNMLEAARIYVEQFGWAVFPLWGITDGRCDCGDPECEEKKRGGKHPYGILAPQGVKNATTMIEEVEYWLDEYPNMNLAVATGKVSGVVVLDVDWEKGGDESFGALVSRYLPDDCNRYDDPLWSRAVQTGGGGLHIYYAWPGEHLKSTQTKFGKAIDFRGDGGSAVLPPSRHLSGRQYEWDNGPEGKGMFAPVLPLPQWVKARAQFEEPVRTDLLTVRRGEGAFKGQRQPITEPGRNNALTRIAGAIHGGGSSREQLRAELHQINQQSCVPPLPPSEVDTIANSVSRYPR